MEVIVAKTAGFCFGVKRAVEQVYEQIEKAERPVYTFGPIIHNEQVVEDLAQKGVRVIDTEEELEAGSRCDCDYPLSWSWKAYLRSAGTKRRYCGRCHLSFC